MQTKLVYVLTCADSGTYIEQALMSVYSARYWNPDAYIVLIVDDKTDLLISDSRSEILHYISEKKVVVFENSSLSMLYRSRWLKTSVRQLVDGDFLFIDCDTIVCKSLSDIDNWSCSIGAVYESHLLVEDFHPDLLHSASVYAQYFDIDISKEKYYFSSGVLFVKDNLMTHKFYRDWHKNWLYGESKGLGIDQPALLKTDIDNGYIINRISDTYNCIVFTQNTIIHDAYILHISSYRNPSFLFSKKILKQIRVDGLSEWIKKIIISPLLSILPFDYDLFYASWSQRFVWVHQIADTWKSYAKYIDSSCEDFPMQSSLKKYILLLMRCHLYYPAIMLWMLWRVYKINSRNVKPSYNVCSKF